jgi:RimJ/RimL family protein N-acetyltransferase
MTERLVLVPLADDHLDLEIALDGDAEVLRHLFPRARTADEVRAKHLERMEEGREVDGLGMWMAFITGAAHDATGFVGLFMLTPRDGQAELGYRIRRDRWRQGFAREGSLELLRHGFETVGLDRVMAQTMTVNDGSRAVMASVGLGFVRSFTEEFDDPVAGSEHGEVEYAVTRDEWEAQSHGPHWSLQG